MPRRRNSTPTAVVPDEPVRDMLMRLRREMLAIIRRGYGWPGAQARAEELREQLLALKVQHSDIWKTLPLPEKDEEKRK